ncbi:hypothetical protein CIK06_09880 [Plantactinospora sp. KBS50]|nr:hypothetical protein CIK06_09880 [Plantactinospora sp. KBS50]
MAEGDLAGAQELLDEALGTADPSPANASPELTEAAGLQARILVALGEPHAARGWAAFAYAATMRQFGASDPQTVAAAATLAAVLHRVGSDARAARLYRDVIIELTAMDGPESLRVLAAHADLATVEFALGRCELARNRLTDAWELHREVYGEAHPSGIKMLARLGAMERDCGRFTEAHDHLARARELCRRHLPANDPLAQQVAALARAAANAEHVCATSDPVGAGYPTDTADPTDTGYLVEPAHADTGYSHSPDAGYLAGTGYPTDTAHAAGNTGNAGNADSPYPDDAAYPGDAYPGDAYPDTDTTYPEGPARSRWAAGRRRRTCRRPGSRPRTTSRRTTTRPATIRPATT